MKLATKPHWSSSFLGSIPAFLLVLLLTSPLIGCGSGGATDGAGADSTQTASSDESGGGGSDDSASADSTAERTKKPREQTTSVHVAEAFRGDLVIPVIAEGTIRARHTTEIRTEIAGPIVRIQAREGDPVRRGQLIAKLDDREYEVAAEEARGSYVRAISLLAIEDESFDIPERPAELQTQIDELLKLEQKGVITREERLAREIALDVEAVKDGHYRLDILASRSGIATARAALERARINLERTEIRAPFSGVVTELLLSEGEHVSIGQTICTLVNNNDLEAEVGVLESDIGFLDVGRPALLAIPALGDTLHITVDVISPRFDRDSRTCQVLLRLENPTGKIRPGMYVRAIVSGQRFPNRLLVPKEAILTRDGRPLLFKVEDKRAKWVYLQLGRQNDDVVEIDQVLQGGSLSPGDLVIVNNHLTLSHDAAVTVKKTVPIRDPWSHVK
jgi:membrane fusion protein (multidrug efflux system)